MRPPYCRSGGNALSVTGHQSSSSCCLPVIRNDLDHNSILNTVSIKEPDAQKLVLAAAKAQGKRLGTPVPKGAVSAEWRPHAPGVQKEYLMPPVYSGGSDQIDLYLTEFQ